MDLFEKKKNFDFQQQKTEIKDFKIEIISKNIKNFQNFYCVKNNIDSDGSIDFNEYCKLREGEHAFYIEKGCSRKWMNISDEERDASGINILWPDLNNSYFKEELERIENEKKQKEKAKQDMFNDL